MSRAAYSRMLDESRLRSASIDTRQGIRLFRSALAEGAETVRQCHLDGDSRIGKRRTWLIDRILFHAWSKFLPPAPAREQPSLVAVGGYGREDLNLESDVDLLVLQPDETCAWHVDSIERFIRFCWDIGLRVGHSARTLPECLEIASADLSVITSLLEVRLIHGDRKRLDSLKEEIRHPDIWPADRFFREKLEEQRTRHQHFSDTGYNLEPNLKESPGGLRDLHMISWVANRYFGTGEFSKLVEHQYLTRQEYRTLIKNRDFLWRLRNGLHCLSGRCEDRLLFDFQNDLAIQLGFKAGRHHLAVEQMMKQYYRTVKDVQLLNEIALQHFEEATLTRKKPRTTPINEHFCAVGNYLETADKHLFRDTPGAMLEMFLVMQQHPELAGVRASTIRQLRSNLKGIDAGFRKNPENHRTFLSMFLHQEGLTHCLRRMNAYGVLGKYFPEFGRVVGQMQHDLFHVFTVDAHSLFVIRNLRRMMIAEHAEELPELSRILMNLVQRERLFLAALCHDIGKGSGQDHSNVGEQIAIALCKRLGMDDYDARFVGWLVQNHLVMSWTAQRKDTSDPRVIDDFARIVKDQEHLDNLYLLTVADIRGTSHTLWNEWKGQLLNNLYRATSKRIRSGVGGAEAIKERIADHKQTIRALLGNTVSPERLENLWQQLDREYFLRGAPQTCAWHAVEICNASLLDLPLIGTRYRSEIRAEQILVVTPESENLLILATRAIDALGLSILDARIHRTLTGLCILSFVVVSGHEEPYSDAALAFHKKQIRHAFLQPSEHHEPVSRNLPRILKQFKVPTTVTFYDDADFGHTTMEVVSHDRPGLLFNVSRALYDNKVRLLSAKISTIGEKVEDTFFITDRDGCPISEERERRQLENRIQELLG